jgi:hypothetical protein
MPIAVGCAETKVEPWLEGLRAALPACNAFLAALSSLAGVVNLNQGY